MSWILVKVKDIAQAIAIGISRYRARMQGGGEGLSWRRCSVASAASCTVIVSAVALAVTRPVAGSMVAAVPPSSMVQVIVPPLSRGCGKLGGVASQQVLGIGGKGEVRPW